MQALRKMSEKQPHLRWLIGSGLAGLFMLIAIVAFTMGEPVQIEAPPLHPSDWILAIAGGIAIPLTLLTYWGLQFLPQPKPRPQAMQEPVQEQPVHRHIILNTPVAKPEVVLRLTSERDEWKRAYERMERKYQESLRVVAASPEPAVERELTYGAVAALIKSGGRLGINEAQKVVRAHGGVAGRDYKPLQEVLLLLAALSPTVPDAPIHEEKQAVNSRVNGECSPVNRAMGRSQPRRGKRGR